jgi:hypothetical protein
MNVVGSDSFPPAKKIIIEEVKGNSNQDQHEEILSAARILL